MVLRVLAIVGLASLLIGLGYLVMGFLGWRGPHRRARFMRAIGFACVYPLVFLIQQTLIHRVMLPAMARERQQSRQKRVDEVAFVKRGDKAPSFKIRDVDGNQFSTDELRGKVVLVNFFATWCGPCLKELPHIQAIWQEHKNRDDFALLVIGREESDATAQGFRTTSGFSFPVAADPDRSVYSLFAKELIPRTFVIAKDGTVSFSSTGFVEEDIAALRTELTTRLGAD